MNNGSRSAKLVLLCPVWKNWGVAKSVKSGTVILDSRSDDVIPFAYSEELVRNSGTTLIEFGNDHRLADSESSEAILRECDGTDNLLQFQPAIIKGMLNHTKVTK